MEDVSGGQAPVGWVICSSRVLLLLPCATSLHSQPWGRAQTTPADLLGVFPWIELWDGMWPCLSGLIKLKGRLYFVAWVGKWHGHPQLQRSNFALVGGK